MDKLMKSRKLQMSMVDSYVKKVNEVYENFDDKKHLTLLNTYEISMKKKLEKAEGLQEDILDKVEDEAEMLELEESFGEFRIFAGNELLILQDFIKKKTNGVDKHSDGSSTSSGRNMRLPKLSIKPFDGNPLNWKTFYDTFMCTIDGNETLSNVERMSYLLNLVEGVAEQTLKGFSLSNDNYHLALKTLQERFGDEQIIITSHMNRLLELPSVESVTNTKTLRNLYDTVESQIRSLTAFDSDIKNYGPFLVPVIMSKIPNEIKLVITRQLDKNTWDATLILKQLQKEIEVREKLNDVEMPIGAGEDLPTGVALHTVNERKTNFKSNCAFCSGNHKHQHCQKVRNVQDRRQKVKQLGMCFLCLRKNHLCRDCREIYRCFHCQGKHHVALCDKKPLNRKENTDKTSETKPNESLNVFCDGKNVLLQTAKAKVSSVDEKKCANFRILFDGGSQHSYIMPEARELLQLQTMSKEKLNLKTFGGSEANKVFDRVKFAVKSANGSENVYVEAFVSDICKPLASQTIELAVENYEHLKNLKLADSNPTNSSLKIDVLIGSDFYWDFMTNEVKKGKEGPVAVSSKLGYVLNGPISSRGSGFSGVVSTHTLKIAAEIDFDRKIERFWDLEAVGVLPNEKPILEEFKEEIKFVDNKYEIKLPFKDNVSTIANNYEVSKTRLKSLWKKLGNDEALYDDYKRIIYEQENTEVIAKVPENENGSGVHYLPHKAVVRNDKITTKTRMVFDASAKDKHEFSLNECLATGPSLTPSLFGVLTRFRSYNYVVVGDIEKAFLQISIRPEDREYVRCLWFEDPENIDWVNFENNALIEYKICRLLFGATCSPFVLTSTLITHVESNSKGDPAFAKKLLESLHVDDLNSGANTKEEAIDFYKRSKECLHKGGFHLQKFQSNSKEIEKQINDIELNESSEKILGLSWDKQKDEFFFDLKKMQLPEIPTKRNILKFTASIYDPLGLINPIVVKLKILFQEICKTKINWDELIEGELLKKWEKVLNDFALSESISFPRSYAWVEDVKNVQLHIFSDASNKAYGCCAYLRFLFKSDEIKTSLVTSKSRVSPLKTTTMPRLELLGTLLGARLLETLKSELGNVFDINNDCFLWTDSSIAYAWIKNEHREYHQFVQNRVSEIRKLTGGHSWKLIRSEHNPADIISRGSTVSELSQNQLWRQGPALLTLPESGWPSLKVGESFSEDAIKEEKTKSNTCLIIPGLVTSKFNVTNLNAVMDINKYNCLNKLLRVSAYVLRFVKKMKQVLKKKEEDTTVNNDNKGKKKEEEDTITKCWLGAEELLEALEYWIIIEQRSINLEKIKDMDVFMDKRGKIRCKGRLKNLSNTTFDMKYPILLETENSLARLIVLDAHLKVGHNGVRDTLNFLQSRYWIRKGRSFVRKILHRCVNCKRVEGKTLKYPSPPDLPKERLDSSRSFNSVGIDYAGPVFVKDVFNRDLPTKKCWIVIITCASSRALCLDVSKDYSGDSCIEILRRFSSRRGSPKCIISDNGSNFTSKEVQNFVAGRGIEWRFNLEAAPWQGGFWERLIRSVKSCLKKTIRNAKLSYDELYTVLLEIELILNNRPLTYMYDEPNNGPLTPNHLLFGRKLNIYAENELDREIEIKERSLIVRDLIEKFWLQWKNEYITELRDFHIKNTRKSNGDLLKEGDIVIVNSDNQKRMNWKLGRVEKMLKSSDGKQRGAQLTISHDTKQVKINRPINKLTLLEVQETEQFNKKNNEPKLTFIDENNILF